MSKRSYPISLYIGIFAASSMAVSDVILLGVPQAGWTGDLSSFGSLPYVSMLRIQIGSTLGWLSSFFICFGFWHLKELLSGINSRLSIWMFAALSFYMVSGGAFHAGYYFAGGAIHQGNTELYTACIKHLELMSYFSATGLVIGTCLYVYLLRLVPGRFSIWYQIFNPLVCIALILSVTYPLPAPVGGYLRPAFLNIGTICFFCQVYFMSRSNTIQSK